MTQDSVIALLEAVTTGLQEAPLLETGESDPVCESTHGNAGDNAQDRVEHFYSGDGGSAETAGKIGLPFLWVVAKTLMASATRTASTRKCTPAA